MIFAQTFRKILGDFTESKTQNFQKDIEYFPKMSFWALLCFFLWFYLKKIVLRTSSDLSTWNNTWFLFKCRVTFWLRYFLNATFGTLALSSCVWDVLQYRIIKKTAFDFFGNVVSVVLYFMQVFWWFSYKPSKSNGRSHRKENTNFPNWRWMRSKLVCLSSASLFSLVVTKKYVLRTSWVSLLEILRVFCSNAESSFGCASFRTLRLVLRLFTSCVWDILGYRILVNSFCFLSKTKTFQDDV